MRYTSSLAFQRYPEVVAVIEAAIREAILEKGGIELAIERAREGINRLDIAQKTITLEASGALRRAVQQVWDRGVDII